MGMNTLKEVELFDDMTLDLIFKEIYDRSTEDRKKALDTYDMITAEMKTDEDIFMIGDKADRYLDIAQKSTDNLTKMLTAAQRLLELDAVQGKDGVNADDIHDILERLDQIPDELRDRHKRVEAAEEVEEPESNFEFVSDEALDTAIEVGKDAIRSMKKTNPGQIDSFFKLELDDEENLERFK